MAASNGQYAIIGGSGFHAFGSEAAGRAITTAYGQPSSAPRLLRYGEAAVWFLARHGDTHDIPPHRINYRANLAALKLLGVERVIGLNTVGVITRGLYPGQLAVPHQVIDYTWGRDHSIHDGESASLDHIDFTEPFDSRLRREILAAGRAADVLCHDGGVYAVTQGPRLETAAEVDRIERDGADFIGMTAMPEAAIARELHMDYACLSLIVNFAAGRGERAIHEDIDANLLAAKMQSMRVLRALFDAAEPGAGPER